MFFPMLKSFYRCRSAAPPMAPTTERGAGNRPRAYRRQVLPCFPAIALLVLMAATASLAGECVLPDPAALAMQYDWHRRNEKNTCLRRINDIPVDYFMLALSYSPRFCRESARDFRTGAVRPHNAFQCEGGNAFGWVVHGLWAQSRHPGTCRDNGKPVALHPRYCRGDEVGPLDPRVIRQYLCVLPGESLLQGEWEKHGTCGGFGSAAEYFAKTRQLYEALVLPKEDVRPPRLFRVLKQANPGLKEVRIGYASGEIRICYDRKWQYIDCP